MPVRTQPGGPIAGTVSVAGPSLRMTATRLAELVPVLNETAEALAAVWPLRARTRVALAAAATERELIHHAR